MPEGLAPKPGEFYNVKITGAHEYDLIGEIV
jgi:tRNA A37 methylthiotransferase MiaB